MGARQEGSALVISILVLVILTVLGVSFLLLGETENRIAENERLSSQALSFAEAGTRAVIQWFDHPRSTSNVIPPPQAAADRTRRKIDEDGDPATPPHDQDGAAWPRYKQEVDQDRNGEDDLFDKPYRFDLRNTFLGTEDGPDVRIDSASTGPGQDFLDDLSEALTGGIAAAENGIRAGISRIDVYAPPTLRIGGQWVRHGIATVKVIGRIYRAGAAGNEILAERMVKAVLNEIPYAAVQGPLQSCTGTTFAGSFTVHWGAVTTVGDSALDASHVRIPASLPRTTPPGASVDLLWGYASDANFSAYAGEIDGRIIEDPWLRVLTSGSLAGAPNGDSQPYPFSWNPGSPLDSGQIPAHEGGLDGSHSNLFQTMTTVECPESDYDLWKSIATSGRSGVEYYTWEAGDLFRRDGVGPPTSFLEITDLDPSDPSRRPTVFFFDTRDGQAPHDDDGNGELDNLTPGIVLDGRTWAPRGFLYLNAASFRAASVRGRPATLRAPGEPFQDKNQNGRWDAGEGWINLRYPGTLTGAFLSDAADSLQDDGTSGPPLRNGQGPGLAADAALHGILCTSGSFDATGPAVHFGSIVARGGVVRSDAAAPGPDIYWDEGIRTGAWPPSGWDLPRVTVTRWETDL